MKENVVEQKKPTVADLRRAGTAIFLAGLIIAGIAGRFTISGEAKDFHAAIMIGVVAAIIVAVGAVIFLTAPRQGQSSAPRSSEPTDSASLPVPPKV